MHLTWRTWLVYVVLLLIAVPWYWQFMPHVAVRIVWGLPLWTLTAVLGSVLVSLFTAYLYLQPGTWADEPSESGTEVDREP